MSASIWQPGSELVNVDAESTVLSDVVTVTAGQTLIPLTEFTYTPDTGSIAVYRNGQKIIRNTDYTETSETQVTLLFSPDEGDVIEVVGIIGSSAANAEAAATSAAEAAASALEAATIVSSTANWPLVDWVQFTGGTGDQGKVSWNATEETLDLIQNGAVLQLGQETQYHCRNETGSTILNGTLVYAAGTHGASGTILIAPYLGNGSISPKLILGIVTYDIANNSFGKVTNFGKVRGLDTSAWTAGSILYPSESVAGALSSSVPVSIAQRLPIAFVINQHATQGTLVVRCTNTPDVVYGTGSGQIPTADQVPGLVGPALTAGAVMHFAMSSAPTGWLKANGATVSRTTYASLFAAIGTTFGAGDGSTTFALPDLRGEFIRSWDDARGVDSGRIFGSAQTDAFKSHYHDLNTRYSGAGVGTGTILEGNTAGTAGVTDTALTGGTETRPRNIALLACIKY